MWKSFCHFVYSHGWVRIHGRCEWYKNSCVRWKQASADVTLKKFFAEYIVLFGGYYTSSARHNFLAAALRDLDVGSWQILPRENAVTSHPSDFDVIKVSQQNDLLLQSLYSLHVYVFVHTRADFGSLQSRVRGYSQPSEREADCSSEESDAHAQDRQW